ncbi:MAG TPA: DUF1559 domain-containing protein, partial [Isosphaeraceae bacterium]|nr:DUF1559 domain-containing protein [Isosphaeraceae bacterium]
MSCRPRLSVRGMMILVAVVLLMLGIGALTISAWEAAIQAGCAYNLRNIGLALHNYHSSFESFPPATIPRPGLPPEKRLSWCVLIYSFADQFFWDLDWNESWDSPRNRVTRGHGVEETPSIQAHCRVFECPKSPLGDEKHMPGWTSYVAIAGVGPDAPRLPKGHPRAGVFGHNRTTSMSEVSDGLSQTMMIVETTRNLGP